MSEPPAEAHLKPLHPRAARPALERMLSQGQIQPAEAGPLAQIYASQIAPPSAPQLPPEASELLQRLAHRPAEREQLLSQLLKLIQASAK